MTHIMVDLETLGLAPGSVILSIGACVFDPLTGKIGETFYQNITRDSCEAAGLTVNPETVAWWADQSAEARARLEADQVHFKIALARFADFYTDNGGEFLWANDPNFDEVMLVAAMAATGQKQPWGHRAPRSCRTIYDLAGVAPDRDVGVEHDALWDARNQAVAVHDAYVKLGLANQPVASDPWRWYAGMGEEPESYFAVADTRDGAIEAVKAQFPLEDGEAFTICEARKGTMKRCLPTAESIIDDMFERADDEGLFGDDGSDSPHSRAAEADLEAVLAAWFDRHAAIFPIPWQFDKMRNVEVIRPDPAEVEEGEEAERAYAAADHEEPTS